MFEVDLDTGGDEPIDDLPGVASDPYLSVFGKKLPEDIESTVKQILDAKQKELVSDQKRQRLALKREHQDETRQRRIQTKLDKRAATDRRVAIRSSAVSQRIQVYSIASSLGFAGYVVASIIDQFGIRPKEQKDIAAEEEYNADYATYQQALEQDQVDRRRQREDEISGMQVDEPAIRKQVIEGRRQPSTAPKSPFVFSKQKELDKYTQKLTGPQEVSTASEEDQRKKTALDKEQLKEYEEWRKRSSPAPKEDTDTGFTKNQLPSDEYYFKIADFAERQNKINSRNETPLSESSTFVDPTPKPTPETTGFKGKFTNEYKDKLLDELNDPNIDPKHRAFNEKLLADNTDKAAEKERFLRKESEYPLQSPLKNNPDKKTRDQLTGYTEQEKLNTDRKNFEANNEPEKPASNEPGEPASTSRNTGGAFKAVEKTLEVAKAIKPNIPATATSFIEKAGPIGLAIAAVVTAAQVVNQTIDKAGENVSKVGKSLFTGSTTSGLKDSAHLLKDTYDPLGVSIPLQVAVTGFDVLLSLTESMKSYAEKNKEFSPLTLQASIEGDIAKLMQSIDLASKNDPLKAALIHQTTRLDMVWNDFKAQMFENLGPSIILALQVLTSHIKVASETSSLVYTVARNTPGYFAVLIRAVEQISDLMSKDPIAGNLFTELSNFMDPNNIKDLSKKAFTTVNKVP